MNAPPRRPKFDAVIDCDVLVIGGGLAGTWAAIRAAQGGNLEVALVDKARVGRSGQSVFSSIFAAFDPRHDDADAWMEELVRHGEYLNDQRWILQLFEHTRPLTETMQEWGHRGNVEVFLEDDQGRRVRRRSLAHVKTQHDIINSVPMMDTMRRQVRRRRVKMIEHVMVTDLVAHDGRILGAIGFAYRSSQFYLFRATSIILAAAGSGLKSIFMGHQNLTGDLQVSAYDIGAILQNMENTAANTCSATMDVHGLNLVGPGSRFINAVGEEFMWQYNPQLGNLARLPEVVLAFCREVEEGRGPIYLDMSAASPADRELCRKILPETFRVLDKAHHDPFETPLEWVPAMYGTITNGGGISINLDCETNIEGLYAAGDITHEPPHGTYSVGGINLAFAAVSGHLAGLRASERARRVEKPRFDAEQLALAGDTVLRRLQPLMNPGTVEFEFLLKEIHAVLIPTPYSFLRTRRRLEESLRRLAALEQEVAPRLAVRDAHELLKVLEVRNILTIGKLMMQAALLREESRGFHFREDFPYTDNVNWLKWVKMQRDGATTKVWTEEVPLPFLRPDRERATPAGIRVAPALAAAGPATGAAPACAGMAERS